MPWQAIGTTANAARDHDQLGDASAIDIGKPDCDEAVQREPRRLRLSIDSSRVPGKFDGRSPVCGLLVTGGMYK